MVNAAEAGDLAERLVGWYLCPAVVEGTNKRPLTPSWQSYAATGRDAVESLWRRFVPFNEDGTQSPAAVLVACDPSGIFVIDEDREWRSDEDAIGPDWQQWATALDSCNSLVLRSSLRGKPHYYFRQPSDGLGRVKERVWHGGEVKSSGYIVLSASDPIYQPSAAGGGLWTPADVVEAIPPLVELIGRRRASDVAGSSSHGNRVTKEEFNVWLGQEPGENFGGRLISEEYESRFIDQLVKKFKDTVDNGTSRRAACLNIVHQATIEAYQGLYSHEAAYNAILDAYEAMRTYGPGDTSGDKGWNQKRFEDFQSMWETEVNKSETLKQAEKTYDELVERMSSSGVNMEVSEDDLAEDAYLMDLIFSAGEEESLDIEALVEPAPSPQPEPEPQPATDDDISWDEIVPDPVPPKPEAPKVPTTAPVKLGEDAKKGVLWDLASGLIGKHELPHEALMITLAAWAGCVLGSVGAGAMFTSGDRHGPELCVCMVGTSAISHKSGTVSFGQMVFQEWDDITETGVGAPGQTSGFFRRVSGIESGQAFIDIWPTAAMIAESGGGVGRAVIMVEKELTSVWKKSARKGSTIPEEIRKAWDGEMLAIRGVRAGNHRVMPQNYRFSAVGATIHSLAASAIVESEAAITGDGNRWLWCWGQEVPYPVKGTPSFDGHPLVEAVRVQVRGLIKSVEQARNRGQWPGTALGPNGIPVAEFAEPKVWWTPEADQAWLGDEGTPNARKGIYNDLRDEIASGASGAPVVRGLKGRGAQQVMRLAIGYEMLKAGDGWADLVRNTRRPDGQSWCLSLEALKWGLAVWRFCADTVEHLFTEATGDTKIDELVLAISEMKRDAGRNFPGYVLKADLVGTGFSKNTISALLAQAENAGAIWSANKKSERGAPKIVVGLSKWPVPPDCIKRGRQ
jgi:hypothetical protein